MGRIDQYLSNPPDPSIRRGLQTGKATAPVRLGLSLASATGLMVGLFAFLGLVDTFATTLGPGHVAPAVAVVGATWCFVLAAIWWTYRPWQRFVRTVIIIAGIWLVMIPVAVLLAHSNLGGGFFVAATIFTGVTASVTTIVVTAYHAYVGRPIRDREGAIAVECPECGYSLVGLEACTCPECGKTFTIDEVIGGQDYAVLRDPTPAEPMPKAPPIVNSA